MALKRAWEEALEPETLSFDVLALPKQPPYLATLDPQRLRLWVWDSGKWNLHRETRHLMQRDLYCLSNAPRNKSILYTDGSGWETDGKQLIPHIPSRQVPIGRVVDEEGIDRIICFDHETLRPVYYVSEKPVLEDEMFLAPETVYEGTVRSLVMQIPRKAGEWNTFYLAGYRAVCLLRADAKEPVQVFGIAPDRIALLELLPQRRITPRWRLNLPSIGTLRREMPLVVRMGDPKGEGKLHLLVMRATARRVVLSAFVKE